SRRDQRHGVHRDAGERQASLHLHFFDVRHYWSFLLGGAFRTPRNAPKISHAVQPPTAVAVEGRASALPSHGEDRATGFRSCICEVTVLLRFLTFPLEISHVLFQSF